MAGRAAGGDATELLAAMGRDFVSTRDLDATLKRALERIAAYVGAEAGALFVFEPERQRLSCRACVGPCDIVGLTLDLGQGVVGRAVRTNAGEIVRDVSRDPQFEGSVDARTGFTTRSILCAPMSVKDERLGAIELINKRGGDGLFDHGDLTFLEALTSSAALAVMNARMAAELVEQELVKRELELAAEIQRSLLPESPAANFPAHGVNRAARMVSGDFFDFFALPDGRVRFALGDVSGKGMNAALLMAKAASLFRCLGRGPDGPGRLMGRLNAEIVDTATRGMFITMVVGTYDPASGVVRLSNAGHEPPLVHHPTAGFSEYEAEAPPLGVLPSEDDEPAFAEIEIALGGGALYIFSDGVTEGYLADGGELGRDGLKRLMAETATLAPAERLAAVTDRLARPGESLRDDVTLLIVDDRLAAANRGQAVSAVPAQSPVGMRANGSGRLMAFRFPALPERLRLVRGAVKELARLNGCSDSVARDIVIAVDEACQNVIRHGYKGRADGEIALEVERQGGDLILLLKDEAPTVDPSMVRPRDLDDIRPGGIGTHLIRSVMDEVAFVAPPPGGGNILRMVKRIA